MQKIAPSVDWKLGMRVLAGFCVVFSTIWFVQLILGVGPNLLLKYIRASENVRVFLGMTVTRLGVLVVIILFSHLGLRRVLGSDLKTVAFSSRSYWWQDLIFGCLLTIISMAAIFGIQVASGWLVIETWIWQSEPLDAFLRNVWISLLSNLDAGVGEEVLFRGFLLTGLCKAWGKRSSLMIVASIFAAFHLMVTGADKTNWLFFSLLLTLPGIVFGDAYLKAGSLWLPIGIHFTWDFAYDLFNFTGGLHPGLFGVVTQQVGPSWFVGTTFGIETGLAGVLVAGTVWLGVLVFSHVCYRASP